MNNDTIPDAADDGNVRNAEGVEKWRAIADRKKRLLALNPARKTALRIHAVGRARRWTLKRRSKK